MNIFTGIYIILFAFYHLFAWLFFKNEEIFHLFGDITKTAQINLSESPVELLLFSLHSFFIIAGLFTLLFSFFNWKRFPWLIFDLGCFSIFYGICSLLTSPLAEYFLKDYNVRLLIFILFVNIVYLPLINGFLRLNDFKLNRWIVSLFYLNFLISIINIFLLFGFENNSEVDLLPKNWTDF